MIQLLQRLEDRLIALLDKQDERINNVEENFSKALHEQSKVIDGIRRWIWAVPTTLAAAILAIAIDLLLGKR